MGRDREEDEVRTLPEDEPDPIPLDPVNLLAGIGSGLELTTDPLPAGVAGNDEDQEAWVSLADVGRLLRVNEATVRKLIRTAVIRPVLQDGKIRVPLRDIEAYRSGLGRGGPGRPGE